MTALSGAQDSWVTSVTDLLFASDADADDFVFVSLTLHADVANTATPATSAATGSGAQSTLAAIKFCESSNNYQAQNPSSTASGAYQFLDTTWQSLDASAGYSRAKFAPASVQDAAALELYNEMGTSPWAASSSCWSSMTSAPATSSTSTTTGQGSSRTS